MVSRVTYRPFDEDDFNTLAAILQKAWHKRVPSPGYGFLEACCDLAFSLSISTFSQVALIDGDPRGIVLARSSSLRSPIAGRWKRASEDYLHQMLIADPTAANAYRTQIGLMESTNQKLLERSGLMDSNEITLLAVAEEARGMGIGSVLLDAAESHLSSAGASRIFLYTDTDCSWPFYERHGFKRAAAHRANRDERKFIPREMYLYDLDLSA